MLFTLFFTKSEDEMRYKFVCTECNKAVEIEMKMSEYTSKGHICECGNELTRDIKDIGCKFDTSKISGFCGKCGG